MIFLESFKMLSRTVEENYLRANTAKNLRTCYATKYPFDVFRYRELPEFHFSDITIFCGGNGSGKSTVLNVLAERLCLERGTVYNRSAFFDDYVELCNCKLLEDLSTDSKIITSDDVFDYVLKVRRLNDGIDDCREEMLSEYIQSRYYENDPKKLQLQGLSDYDRWSKMRDIKSKNSSQYLRKRLMQNVVERSNGESALSYFVDAIADNALYLLDEPENSLSPSNQLELKYFLEDCVRTHGCQFVISTHSPFLLSLAHARIYDLDSTPPITRRFSELECVRVYHEFFAERTDEFN